jgi:hypothetical protein
VANGFMHPARTSAERKESPTFRGCVRYFPAALELVGRLSKIGNDKHNPGEEMHHSRGRSNDHGDCIVRHQQDVGKLDDGEGGSGLDHAVAVAWRALAQLQELAEKQYGWPVAPGAKLPAPGTEGPGVVVAAATPFLFRIGDKVAVRADRYKEDNKAVRCVLTVAEPPALHLRTGGSAYDRDGDVWTVSRTGHKEHFHHDDLELVTASSEKTAA